MDPGDVVVGGDCLEHAGLDVLTPASLLPQVERGCDAADEGSGGGVAYALGDDVVGARPGVLVGEHHHPPALGGHHGVVSLVVRVGSPGPEARQRGVDQFGMAVAEVVVVDAQPPGDAGAVVLDDHVGVSCQCLRLPLAVGSLQVEDDALLPAVPLDGAGSVPELFTAGRLDLDDLGTEVGHHHGGDAAGTTAGEVEDRDSIKDLCHRAPLSVVWRIDADVPDLERQGPGPKLLLGATNAACQRPGSTKYSAVTIAPVGPCGLRLHGG